MEAAAAIFEGKFDDAVDGDEDGDVDMAESVGAIPARTDGIQKRKAQSVISFAFVVPALSIHFWTVP
jgi:hypothetical protein